MILSVLDFRLTPSFVSKTIFSVLLSFLLRYHNFYKETSEGKKALEMCLHTMRMMAKGGVYDHVSQVSQMVDFTGDLSLLLFFKYAFDV